MADASQPSSSTQLTSAGAKRSREATASQPITSVTPSSGDAAGASVATAVVPESVVIQFQTAEGTSTGPPVSIPSGTSTAQLQALVRELLRAEGQSPEDDAYAFYMKGAEFESTVGVAVQERAMSAEGVLPVMYTPVSMFRVAPVTRCTDSLPGHSGSILHIHFSPDGQSLASGGGDGSVRFWDALTKTPKWTGTAHTDHVLCTAFAPDGVKFASGDRSGTVHVWAAASGKQVCKPLKGHKGWVSCIAWEPLHANPAVERLATGGKDGLIRVWSVRTGRFLFSLAGHTDAVEALRWGGSNLIYSASRDRTVRVWSLEDGSRGKLIRQLKGHAHRINALALSTDAVLRTGCFTHTGKVPTSAAEAQVLAKSRYDAVAAGGERLVSASDDCTLFLWAPETSNKPVARLTGHQQLVPHIAFSPDGRLLASASFDKKIKLWDGLTGTFMLTLTGHVGSVYQVAWSPDSRYLASASKDSTVKVWKVCALGVRAGRAGRPPLGWRARLTHTCSWPLCFPSSRPTSLAKAKHCIHCLGMLMKCLRWTGAQMALLWPQEAAIGY